MRDKISASGANAAVIAVTLLFAACSEHERAATSQPSLQQSGDPASMTDKAPTLASTMGSAAADGIDAGETGLASWYGAQYHGKRTASGAPLDMHAMTAAHPTLPLGTMVMVENLGNGRAAAVRITDRGPYIKGRIIDLSLAAALQLGLKGDGTAPVRIKVMASSPTPATGVAASR